jgi:hypothetical protein
MADYAAIVIESAIPPPARPGSGIFRQQLRCLDLGP